MVKDHSDSEKGNLLPPHRLLLSISFMHHPTDRITHTTAFVTPVVDHWLEWEIAQWVHPMKDRCDDPSHHERTLYLWATSRSLYIWSNSPISKVSAHLYIYDPTHLYVMWPHTCIWPDPPVFGVGYHCHLTIFPNQFQLSFLLGPHTHVHNVTSHTCIWPATPVYDLTHLYLVLVIIVISPSSPIDSSSPFSTTFLLGAETRNLLSRFSVRKEGNVLFNDTLNTFNFMVIYGKGRKEGIFFLFNDTLNTFYLVIWHQTCGKGPISSKDYFIRIIPQRGYLIPWPL